MRRDGGRVVVIYERESVCVSRAEGEAMGCSQFTRHLGFEYHRHSAHA